MNNQKNREKSLWSDTVDGNSPNDAVTHFHYLFCFIFLHLDHIWVSMKATYMDFPIVLQVIFLLFFESFFSFIGF